MKPAYIRLTGISILVLLFLLAGASPGLAWLEFVETHRADAVPPPDLSALNGTRDVKLTADGRHLYATAPDSQALNVFSRSKETGALTFVQTLKDGIGGVNGLDSSLGLEISPDGAHVYTASQTEHSVALFNRNASTGELTFVELLEDGVGGVDGLNQARDVAVSPDGQHVYAGGGGEIGVFSRNEADGHLSFIEMHSDGAYAADCGSAWMMAVSPDGRNLYLAGETALTVYSRNETTGELTYLESHLDGATENGITYDFGAWAYGLSISPDGLNVYLTSVVGGTNFYVFQRNAATGSLLPIQTPDSSGGGSITPAVEPFGHYVYLTNQWSDNLRVYTRSPVDGQLTFLEEHVNGVAGVDGLDTAYGTHVGFDGRHVYTGSFSGVTSAVSVFRAPEHTLTVSKSGTGSGLVGSDPAGLDCGTDCAAQYVADALISLKAVPDPDSLFTGWSGDCTGDAQVAQVVMATDRNCTANFDLIPVPPQPASYSLTLPAGSTAAAYRIVSFPLELSDPDPLNFFEPLVGSYDTSQVRIGYWDAESQSYEEYPFQPAQGPMQPGDAGWFLFREGKTLNFQGTATTIAPGPDSRESRALVLAPGWNQVGNPFLHPVDVIDIIVEDQDMSHAYLTGANSITQPVFWVYRNGSYLAAETLNTAEGGWVKKLTPGWGSIYFPSATVSPDLNRPTGKMPPTDGLETPPAPPTGLDQPSGGSSSGGGCFVEVSQTGKNDKP